MVVKELIEILQKLDQDMKVFVFDEDYSVFEEIDKVLLNASDENGFKVCGGSCDGYLIHG